MLLGVEALRLQGLYFDPVEIGVFSNELLQDLAGNAFTTTICSAFILSVISAQLTVGAAPSAVAETLSFHLVSDRPVKRLRVQRIMCHDADPGDTSD